MPVSVQHIEEALRRLGGQAHLDDIVKLVSEIAPPPITENVASIVRGRLQDFYRKGSSYKEGRPELFYSVHGLPARRGWWGLIAARRTSIAAQDAEDNATDAVTSFDPALVLQLSLRMSFALVPLPMAVLGHGLVNAAPQ